MKLYISRHAQTEWNKVMRLQGWKDSPLSEKGLREAHLLKDYLADIKFDRIYTSDKKRAIDTAKIIKGPRHIEIVELKELRELGMGDWEGKLISEIMEEEGDLFDKYLNFPLSYPAPLGEDIPSLFKRVEFALEKIEGHGGEKILLVSHGNTIRALLVILKKLGMDYYKKAPIYPGTALSIFKKEANGWISMVEGDQSHCLDE